MSEHFRTPEDYELFLYTLADHVINYTRANEQSQKLNCALKLTLRLLCAELAPKVN